MGESPLRPIPGIQVQLDGVADPFLARDALAVRVHATTDWAEAGLTLSLRDLTSTGVTLGRTVLTLRVDSQDVFSGTINEAGLFAGASSGAGSWEQGQPGLRGSETVASPEATVAAGQAGGPALTLTATGSVAPAPGSARVLLRFGAEVVRGSVRKRDDGLVADLECSSINLRCGSRVQLDAPDDAFDGVFTVTEWWLMFDLHTGLRTRILGTTP